MRGFHARVAVSVSQLLLFATCVRTSLGQSPFLTRAARFGGVPGGFFNMSYVNIPELNCNGTNCRGNHDAIRQQRTEQIRQTVLQNIRMAKPPNVSVEPRDPGIRKAVQKVLERDREEVLHYQASIPNQHHTGAITEIVSFGEQGESHFNTHVYCCSSCSSCSGCLRPPQCFSIVHI